ESAGRCVGSPVALKRDRVHGDRVAEEVEELPVAAGGMRTGEPVAVVERAVDGLGVRSSGVEVLVFRSEGGMGRRCSAGPVTVGLDAEPSLASGCNMNGGSSGGPWFRAPFVNGSTNTINSVTSYRYN